MNTPGMYPKFPGISSFVRRSDFLDTTRAPYWSMFMPGQSMGRPYPPEVPSTWPPTGAPLRVPKVLFLTSCPPAHLYTNNFTLISKWSKFARGYLGHHDDAVARDTRFWSPAYAPATVNPYGSLVFDGFVGGYDYIGWTCDPQNLPREEGRRLIRKYATIPNPIVTEHLRLVAEFAIAKSTLESRYPGRVFVQICEFFPSAPSLGIAPNDEMLPRVLDVYTPAGIEANTPKHFANGPTWMLGPDFYNFNLTTHQNEMNFFGTDFAHIYCGYQSSDNVINDDGFLFRGAPDITDLITRYNWDDGLFGYKLDTSFFAGYDQFLVNLDPTDSTYNDGYEYGAYDKAVEWLNTVMNNTSTLTIGPLTRTLLKGKLDLLKLGFPNFASYATELHQYDMTFPFPGSPPNFRTGVGSLYPRGDTIYEDQDWVEDEIVGSYDTRRDTDPNLLGDRYYPGADYDSGVYNFYNRYPATDQYINTWTPQLHNQFNWLKQVLNDLGPKTSDIWDQLIEENHLDDFGFTRPETSGSSTITADYIIAWAEARWNLKEHFG